MANDIPGPISANIEKFRAAVRVHKCEALGCPYCLIRDWVNEIEEELSKIIAISNEETHTGIYKNFEDKQYEQKMADFNRKLTADFASDASTT